MTTFHYMGGAMMLDNVSWPSDMWGWVALPPDPVVVGERWQEQWRERIRNMSFWLERWGGHQTRDRYWSETSVREHYDKVKVPVFVLSGWEDGYKNSIDRAVRALGGLGRPVSGLVGPWGHKYPFDGHPGPRIDWLQYIVTHSWTAGSRANSRTRTRHGHSTWSGLANLASRLGCRAMTTRAAGSPRTLPGWNAPGRGRSFSGRASACRRTARRPAMKT
jgi:predicted acyl esterase